MSTYYSAFHKTLDKRFLKFVEIPEVPYKLGSWLCGSQSNSEFGNKVVNFTPNFVGKLRSL